MTDLRLIVRELIEKNEAPDVRRNSRLGGDKEIHPTYAQTYLIDGTGSRIQCECLNDGGKTEQTIRAGNLIMTISGLETW